MNAFRFHNANNNALYKTKEFKGPYPEYKFSYNIFFRNWANG